MDNRTVSRTPDGLRVHGIEVTANGIFELDKGKRAVFIERSTIERCTLRSGFVAERAVLGLVVGLCMALLGSRMALNAFAVFDASPSRVGAGGAVGGGAIAGLGSIMVLMSLRRGFYLELQTRSGIRKLTVGKSLMQREASSLVDGAREMFGYRVEVQTGLTAGSNERAV